MYNDFVKYIQTIIESLKIVLERTFFTFFYFIGIGAVAVVAKLVGKRFLTNISDNTNWEAPSGSNDLTKMY